ncbi:MAG: F0F1 ATP synthase subunit delta [Deltaproteobacteria bacterium]|nr:F0F1 ATP synthase subunit delta [Deltaproteobacteria bacterium]
MRFPTSHVPKSLPQGLSRGKRNKSWSRSWRISLPKASRRKVSEDSGLIGGMIVKIGDLVLDGSVKAQLEGLKESLKRGEYS